MKSDIMRKMKRNIAHLPVVDPKIIYKETKSKERVETLVDY
jgi:hypothetical protein